LAFRDKNGPVGHIGRQAIQFHGHTGVKFWLISVELILEFMQGNPFAPREAAEERPSISGRTGEGGLNQVIPFPGENVCPETSHHLFLGMPAVIRSEPMQRLLKLVERVARSNAAVLITGESGTGKELIARAIHHYSMRCSRAWVDLNCAALPELLLESELFGYEKGAFSGAAATKPGLLELANTGSVFLDEIGELPPRMQVKLLRVLDGAPYYRLGGTRKISVDSRVIAATNADLEKALKEGSFRRDLYHRLAQVEIRVPPLRERTADIAPLACFFLEQEAPEQRFSQAALRALEWYDWPGNVRELRNVLERASILTDGDIDCRHLSLRRKSRPAAPTDDLQNIERVTIERVLDETNWNKARAARRLGLTRTQLYGRLRRYSLEPPPPFTDSGSTAAVCSFSRSSKARSEARLSEQQHEGRGSGSGRAPERHHHVVTNRVGAERG